MRLFNENKSQLCPIIAISEAYRTVDFKHTKAKEQLFDFTDGKVCRIMHGTLIGEDLVKYSLFIQ